MENVEPIIASAITVVVLFLALSFGSASFKSVADRMWDAIENLVGETVTAFYSDFCHCCAYHCLYLWSGKIEIQIH